MPIINRRELLIGAATTLAYSAFPIKNAIANAISLKAEISKHLLLREGKQAEVWAYNKTVPGEMLRFKQGERARIKFTNNLPQPTSVHWHGIRIENEMDGVAGMTQAAIQKNEDFLYEFELPDAGTYWYHPHNRSWDQLSRGLYGPLIIEERSPYPVDHDVTWLLDDWRIQQDGTLDLESMGNAHDWSHGGRLGNFGTVNGQSKPSYDFPKDSRIRLRLINVANARVLRLLLQGLEATVIALDGQPLEKPKELKPDEVLSLAPAQRADLVIDVKGSGSLQALGRERNLTFAKIETTDGPNMGLTKTPVMPLPSNGLPEPDMAKANNYELVMQGGAMRWLEKAVYHGKEMSGRELAQEKQFWSFNGTSGHSHTPLFNVSKGTSVSLNIVNETMWPHGIHLHGHHFREIHNDGTPPGPWRDTILLERQETKRIAFVADNPGKWMLHCHMLEHQAAGMGTWFQVV